MEYGICNLAVIPLRAEAAHRSEQVSQLLFGETFEIIGYADEWVHIVTSFDGYEGWIGRMQYAPTNADSVLQLLNKPAITTRAIISAARKETDNSVLYLPFGSSLSFYDGVKCRIGHDDYRIDITDELNTFLEIAYSFLNAPYQWGGRTHFGVDCSGYTQAVLRTQGIHLKRDALQQATQGKVVGFLQEAKPGDLAFFDNPEGRITHVGIMLDNQTIIHASGKVKIDHIDNQGIYSAEQKKYTHKLRIVKRMTADFI